MDSKTIRQQAEDEVAAERALEGKKKLKAKIAEREKAKTLLANIEREIEDIEKDIGEGKV